MGCAAMVASLPAGLAGAAGAVGITGSGAFALALAGAAQPLFLGSAILLTAGALACSRVVALLAALGSLLLYLSMFELAGGSGSMTAMATTHAAPVARAEPITFSAGLALLLLSITLQIWRRRRRACRPGLRIRRAHSG